MVKLNIQFASATTHSDLILRAQEIGAKLYHYGQTVSIPFFNDNWRPDSFYDKIAFNRKGGLHTDVDIKVKEPDFEAMARGRTVFLPPRFMTVNQAVEQLLEVEDKRQEGVYSRDTLCVGLARLGQTDQKIVAGTMAELLTVDFGAPLHSLVIAGDVHVLEQEMLAQFSVKLLQPAAAKAVEEESTA
ncbi:hypothetical protein DYB32_008891 [Aphanomyces invadans]|uniref:Uncharacterized protein n=1 Tax=Aphanomyces invadans TaxID=157072 RepID=A0A3R7A3Q3_9STRA|nr:hypothetical protein DYB32_008891 [Aphanomyces invadans]